MKRRIAVVGDTLSSGGTITAYAGPPFTFEGHQIALIGGQAFCTTCKRSGFIAKSGGTYRISVMGEAALDGDVVMCGCPVPPRIVAALSGDAWCDDMIEQHGAVPPNPTKGTGAAGFESANDRVSNVFDDQFVIRDKHTKQPLSNVRYSIKDQSGNVLVSGISDEQGRTVHVRTANANTLKLDVKD